MLCSTQRMGIRFCLNDKGELIDSKESKDLYHAQLTALHNILLDAMKCKQTINTNNITSLLNNLNNFVNLYFDDHGKKHLRELN